MVGRCIAPVRLKILCLVLLVCTFTKAQLQRRPINSGQQLPRWQTGRPINNVQIQRTIPVNVFTQLQSRFMSEQRRLQRQRRQRTVFTQQPSISRQRMPERTVRREQPGNTRTFRPWHIQHMSRWRQNNLLRNRVQAIEENAQITRPTNANRHTLRARTRTRQSVGRRNQISAPSNRQSESANLNVQNRQSATRPNQHISATSDQFRSNHQLISSTNVIQPVRIVQPAVELINNSQQTIDTPNMIQQFVSQDRVIQQRLNAKNIIERTADTANILRLRPAVASSPVNNALPVFQQRHTQVVSNIKIKPQTAEHTAPHHQAGGNALRQAHLGDPTDIISPPKLGVQSQFDIGGPANPTQQSIHNDAVNLIRLGIPIPREHGVSQNDQTAVGHQTRPVIDLRSSLLAEPNGLETILAPFLLSATGGLMGSLGMLQPIRLSNDTETFMDVKPSINNMKIGVGQATASTATGLLDVHVKQPNNAVQTGVTQRSPNKDTNVFDYLVKQPMKNMLTVIVPTPTNTTIGFFDSHAKQPSNDVPPGLIKTPSFTSTALLNFRAKQPSNNVQPEIVQTPTSTSTGLFDPLVKLPIKNVQTRVVEIPTMKNTELWNFRVKQPSNDVQPRVVQTHIISRTGLFDPLVKLPIKKVQTRVIEMPTIANTELSNFRVKQPNNNVQPGVVQTPIISRTGLLDPLLKLTIKNVQTRVVEMPTIANTELSNFRVKQPIHDVQPGVVQTPVILRTGLFDSLVKLPIKNVQTRVGEMSTLANTELLNFRVKQPSNDVQPGVVQTPIITRTGLIDPLVKQPLKNAQNGVGEAPTTTNTGLLNFRTKQPIHDVQPGVVQTPVILRTGLFDSLVKLPIKNVQTRVGEMSTLANTELLNFRVKQPSNDVQPGVVQTPIITRTGLIDPLVKQPLKNAQNGVGEAHIVTNTGLLNFRTKQPSNDVQPEVVHTPTITSSTLFDSLVKRPTKNVQTRVGEIPAIANTELFNFRIKQPSNDVQPGVVQIPIITRTRLFDPLKTVQTRVGEMPTIANTELLNLHVKQPRDVHPGVVQTPTISITRLLNSLIERPIKNVQTGVGEAHTITNIELLNSRVKQAITDVQKRVVHTPRDINISLLGSIYKDPANNMKTEVVITPTITDIGVLDSLNRQSISNMNTGVIQKPTFIDTSVDSLVEQPMKKVQFEIVQTPTNTSIRFLDSTAVARQIRALIHDVYFNKVAKSMLSSQMVSPLIDTHPAETIIPLNTHVQHENINKPMQSKIVSLPHHSGIMAVEKIGTANTQLQTLTTNNEEKSVVREKIKQTVDNRLRQSIHSAIEIPKPNMFVQLSNSPSVIVEKTPDSEHNSGSPSDILRSLFGNSVVFDAASSSLDELSVQAPQSKFTHSVPAPTVTQKPHRSTRKPVKKTKKPTTTTTTTTQRPSTTTTEENEIEAEDMTTTEKTTASVSTRKYKANKQIQASKNVNKKQNHKTKPHLQIGVGSTLCTPLSSEFNCVGKEMFGSLKSVGPWCLGMCIKRKCVDSVCNCGCSKDTHGSSLSVSDSSHNSMNIIKPTLSHFETNNHVNPQTAPYPDHQTGWRDHWNSRRREPKPTTTAEPPDAEDAEESPRQTTRAPHYMDHRPRFPEFMSQRSSIRDVQPIRSNNYDRWYNQPPREPYWPEARPGQRDHGPSRDFRSERPVDSPREAHQMSRHDRGPSEFDRWGRDPRDSRSTRWEPEPSWRGPAVDTHRGDNRHDVHWRPSSSQWSDRGFRRRGGWDRS